MKTRAKIALWVVVGFIVLSALVCMSPWYSHPVVTVLISLIKPLGLGLSALLAFVVSLRLEKRGTQRSSFLVLGIGMALQFLGQSWIAYYQVIEGVSTPFPTLGDLFYSLSCGFILWALLSFALVSYRSGLPLGGKAFWWPAIATLLLGLVAFYPLLSPIWESHLAGLELFLSLYYPIYSLIALAPCLVMLRLAALFQGGGLIKVWLPFSVGMFATLLSDLFYSYLTSTQLSWSEPLIDWLYLSAYLLIPAGIFWQLALLGRASDLD